MRWILLLAVALLLSACAAKVGPGEDGWAKWDLCGWEGGVAAEITLLAMTARLGCTNPAADAEPEPTP